MPTNRAAVVAHPLVLLSVTDHRARSIARGVLEARRDCAVPVSGVLLGQDNGRLIKFANSFGVPFEEDDRDSETWFLDHNYTEPAHGVGRVWSTAQTIVYHKLHNLEAFSGNLIHPSSRSVLMYTL